MESAKYVAKYLLYYTSNTDEKLNAYIHFPCDRSPVTALCDANWGPMDASVPKPGAPPVEQSFTSLRSVSGWQIFNAGYPIAWGWAHHKDMAQSSCQAEIHNMNEPTKFLLELKLLFRDLNMPLTLSIPIKNDNKGAVDWSKGTTTLYYVRTSIIEWSLKDMITQTVKYFFSSDISLLSVEGYPM